MLQRSMSGCIQSLVQVRRLQYSSAGVGGTVSAACMCALMTTTTCRRRSCCHAAAESAARLFFSLIELLGRRVMRRQRISMPAAALGVLSLWGA